MSWRMTALPYILLGTLTTAAGAQQVTSFSHDAIVVQGRAESPTLDQVQHQARQITQGSDFLHQPLARFNASLCPGVVGLEPEFASLMIDRMRASAKALDIWLAKDDHCQANLVVAFVEDGKASLEALAAKHGNMFYPMTTAERKELLAEGGPVRVWTLTSMRSRDGMPIRDTGELDRPPVVHMDMAHSKIYLPVQRDIEQVVVFYDRAAVRGKTLVQLADYATMRGFARTKPSSDGRVMASILELFDPAATPPPEMTQFDRAYLASLYANIPNIAGGQVIGGVTRQLRRPVAQRAP